MLKLKRVEDIFLFLTLLFLPTQLGKHFWPDFSYIYSLKIDYLSPTLYFWDILVAGLLLTWFLQKPAVNRLALNLFLFFLLTQGLSLFRAGSVGAVLVRMEQYTLSGLLGIFIASQDFKSLSKKIYLPFILAVFGEAVLAILQFTAGGTLGLWILGERTFTLSTPGIAKFDFYGREFLRPYGTFPHPNVLAGYLLLTVVILRRLVEGSPAYAGLKQVERFFTTLRMTIFNTSVLLGGLTILLTMSRTTMAAGFMVVLVLFKRKWFLLMGVLLLILSPILFTRFFSLFNFDNLTLLRREELIGNAWQIFLKHQVFGVGLNNFISTVASDLTIGPSRFLQPVHNIILLVLSETGIIGLIGLVVLIGFPIFKLLRLHPKPYPDIFRGKFVYTLTPFLLPWLIIIFLGMFDHYFLTLPQGYRLLFLVWGLTFSMLK